MNLKLKKCVLPHFIFSFHPKKSGETFELKIIVIRGICLAVERNRIKRVVREFFRKKRTLIGEVSVVCKIRPQAKGIKNADIFQELNSIL